MMARESMTDLPPFRGDFLSFHVIDIRTLYQDYKKVDDQSRCAFTYSILYKLNVTQINIEQK